MYPNQRNRRLRQSPAIRALVRENQLSVNDLMLPLFVCEGTHVKEPINCYAWMFQNESRLVKRGSENYMGFRY